MATNDQSLADINARLSGILARVYETGGRIDYYQLDARLRLAEYDNLLADNRLLVAEVTILRAEIDILKMQTNQPEIQELRAS